MKYTAEELGEFFRYLDELRESGETNMYEAGAYLQQEYGFERKEAGEVLALWTKTFSDEDPHDRANAAQ